jgi:hypothetical protein
VNSRKKFRTIQKNFSPKNFGASRPGNLKEKNTDFHQRVTRTAKNDAVRVRMFSANSRAIS